MAFTPEVLTPHLLPLLSNSNADVRNAAYAALSHYMAPDLYPHLPIPTELVAQILQDSSPARNVSDLLASLIRHECKHMRRAVFKGLAVSAGVKAVDAKDGEDGEEGMLRKVVRDVGDDVRGVWESGKGVAGVRSGFAGML